MHYSHSAAGATALVDELHAAGAKAESFAADFNDVEPTRQLREVRWRLDLSPELPG